MTNPQPSNPSYGPGTTPSPQLVRPFGLTGNPQRANTPQVDDDPSLFSSAVLSMSRDWKPILVCTGGTEAFRQNATELLPIEPREHEDAYARRVFHATLAPFLLRLAGQAAGTILRKGVILDGPDYWTEWSQDVTGDGTTLDEFARKWILDALLFGHSSTLVDYPDLPPPTNLREQQQQNRRPYLVQVSPPQILGWHTKDDHPHQALDQVRISEIVNTRVGRYGEQLFEQIRVIEPGKFELWRRALPVAGTSLQGSSSAELELYRSGPFGYDGIPLVTVYSNRLATLISKPPLLEVAHLNIAYAQRFADYHHSIHVGSMPILLFKGYDADASDEPVGLSVNNAISLPVDGDGKYVEPTTACFDAQLQCLQALESQISRLGINTLAQQNITNAAAEARRLDRIDSDSIMAVISKDLERALTEMFEVAGTYAGVEPPEVHIPQDFEHRLLDGNQITSYLQLYMQGAISQETLLQTLQLGEVLPPGLDIPEEITRTKEYLEEQMAAEMKMGGLDQAAAASRPGQANNTQPRSNNQTLPTPMRGGSSSSNS